MTPSKKEIKRFRRYRGYDYSRGAALFITIVTNPRRRLFGRIVDAKLVKTQLGLSVERRLVELGLASGIRLFKFVVMPDHVHFQIHLRAGLAEPLVTLGRAVGAFKSLCAKDYHEITGESGSLWQQGYHDWLCLSEEMIAAVGRSIDYNPLKFELRYNQPEVNDEARKIATQGGAAQSLLSGQRPVGEGVVAAQLALVAARRFTGCRRGRPCFPDDTAGGVR